MRDFARLWRGGNRSHDRPRWGNSLRPIYDVIYTYCESNCDPLSAIPVLFSQEEARIHIHVTSGEGEAKFWLDPATKLAMSKGLTALEVRELSLIVTEHEDEIRAHWRRQFGD